LQVAHYYFKTKAEIGEAVIARQVADVRQMREQAGAISPRDGLLAFVQAVSDNRDGLACRGSPVGTLTCELNKEDGPLARQAEQPFQALLE
jgi:TetR/AcrR family transcriptional regulator, transcriptional repressor for nem operon